MIFVEGKVKFKIGLRKNEAALEIHSYLCHMMACLLDKFLYHNSLQKL